MRRSIIAIIVLLNLSACAAINVTEVNGTKRIELTDPPITAFPRRAAFTHPEVTMAMQSKAFEICPLGYDKRREQYLADNGKGKDALVWEITCYKK